MKDFLPINKLGGADLHCVFHDGQMEQEAGLFVIHFAAYHALVFGQFIPELGCQGGVLLFPAGADFYRAAAGFVGLKEAFRRFDCAVHTARIQTAVGQRRGWRGGCCRVHACGRWMASGGFVLRAMRHVERRGLTLRTCREEQTLLYT